MRTSIAGTEPGCSRVCCMRLAMPVQVHKGCTFEHKACCSLGRQCADVLCVLKAAGCIANSASQSSSLSVGGGSRFGPSVLCGNENAAFQACLGHVCGTSGCAMLLAPLSQRPQRCVQEAIARLRGPTCGCQ